MEQKIPDTIETLTEEMNQLFSLAGQLQYRLEVDKAQLLQANQKILELNQKAHALKQAEVPAEQVPAPSPTV